MAQELTISERLDWLLRQRGMSQNTLARVARVSPQTIANTLHHGRVPQVRTTQRWARALGVPTSFFAKRPMTEDQLLEVLEKAGASMPATGDAGRPTTSTTRKATPVKQTTTGASRRSTTATKSTTKAKLAAKPTSKVAAKAKAAASAKRKGAANSAAARSKATPAAKSASGRTTAGASRTTSASRAKSTTKVVRHSTKGRTGTVAARSGGNGAGLGIDREALLKKLVKLTSSREDAVALDATKTLLAIVK